MRFHIHISVSQPNVCVEIHSHTPTHHQTALNKSSPCRQLHHQGIRRNLAYNNLLASFIYMESELAVNVRLYRVNQSFDSSLWYKFTVE